jgi:ribosomal 30S subunit maturation factor RimM
LGRFVATLGIGGEARLSSQLESRHFFKTRDIVQDRDGRIGQVVSGWSLYAVVAWTDGGTEEIDQFDPGVEVLTRGESA